MPVCNYVYVYVSTGDAPGVEAVSVCSGGDGLDLAHREPAYIGHRLVPHGAVSSDGGDDSQEHKWSLSHGK